MVFKQLLCLLDIELIDVNTNNLSILVEFVNDFKERHSSSYSHIQYFFDPWKLILHNASHALISPCTNKFTENGIVDESDYDAYYSEYEFTSFVEAIDQCFHLIMYYISCC